MHKFTPLALLYASFAAHAGVGLYAGNGKGNPLAELPTYDECVKAGNATIKRFSCRTLGDHPAPAPAASPVPAPVFAPEPTAVKATAPAPSPAPTAATTAAPAAVPSAAPAPSAVAPTSATGFTYCAGDRAMCLVSTPSLVIYGAGSQFTAPKQVADNTYCADFNFVDANLAPAGARACYVKADPNPPAPLPPPAPISNGDGTVTAWVRAGLWWTRDAINALPGAKLRIGDGLKWFGGTMAAGTQCTMAAFGKAEAAGDAAGMGFDKWCEVQVTVPTVSQVAGAMPVVNKGLIPKPSVAAAGPQVLTLTAAMLATGQFSISPGSSEIGAFRVPVPYSHISNDDPIVYPCQPGMAHLHTFAGNSLAGACSTYETLSTTGASTSAGGTLNRTAYWFPTMIDTRTGQPLVPLSTNFYYKGGYQNVDPTSIQPFPHGLRMIAGDSTFKSSHPEVFHTQFRCIGGPANQYMASDHVMSCDVGAQLWATIIFPQCWDGVNVDSPDHKSHMAYGVGSTAGLPNGCPNTHPVALPEVSQNVQYVVTEPGIGDFWKLSSDMYSGPGGYSLHADWFGAWDDDTIKLIVKNCINAKADCHDNILGDGRLLF